jgi:hypothetical protein
VTNVTKKDINYQKYFGRKGRTRGIKKEGKNREII